MGWTSSILRDWICAFHAENEQRHSRRVFIATLRGKRKKANQVARQSGGDPAMRPYCRPTARGRDGCVAVGVAAAASRP